MLGLLEMFFVLALAVAWAALELWTLRKPPAVKDQPPETPDTPPLG